jgi:hypothetical protein
MAFAQDLDLPEPEPEPEFEPERIATIGNMHIVTYFEYKVAIPNEEFLQAQRVWRLRAQMGKWFNPPPRRIKVIRHYYRFPLNKVTAYFEDGSDFIFCISFSLYDSLAEGDKVRVLYNEDGPLGLVKIDEEAD